MKNQTSGTTWKMTLEDDRMLLELWKAPEGTAEPRALLNLKATDNDRLFVQFDSDHEWEPLPETPPADATPIEYTMFMIEVAEEYARRISPHHPLHATYKTYAINLKELLHRMKKEKTVQENKLKTVGTFTDEKGGAWRFSVFEEDLVVESWEIPNKSSTEYIIHPIIRIPLNSFRKASKSG